MEKIRKVTDISNNRLTSQMQEYMFMENLKPSVDLSSKSWTLIRVLKTETANVPWLIMYDDMFYVAIQSDNRRFGSNGVSFYPSNEKGRYTISLKTQITRLYNYVDLEAACDQFTDNLYAQKMKESLEIN